MMLCVQNVCVEPILIFERICHDVTLAKKKLDSHKNLAIISMNSLGHSPAYAHYNIYLDILDAD